MGYAAGRVAASLKDSGIDGVFARVEGTVGGDPVDRQKRPVQNQIRLHRRGPHDFGERGGEGGQEPDGLGDVAVDGGSADPETSRELGIRLAVAEGDEGEQGLPTRAQAPPSGAEDTTVFPQSGSEEAQVRAEHVDAGRVDKHTKPLVEAVLLVETHLPGASSVRQANYPSDR